VNAVGDALVIAPPNPDKALSRASCCCAALTSMLTMAFCIATIVAMIADDVLSVHLLPNLLSFLTGADPSTTAEGLSIHLFRFVCKFTHKTDF
jgi:hypothetical protein